MLPDFLNIETYNLKYNNKKLESSAYEIGAQIESKFLSNQNGATEHFLYNKPLPSLWSDLLLDLTSIIKDVTKLEGWIYSWLNINKPGSYNQPHAHSGNNILLSGVYYIKVPKNAGRIVFYYKQEKHFYMPTAGELLTFPYDLVHSVEQNKSSEDRISLAFNYYLKSER